MNFFLDTSALIKRYIEESGTEIVDGIFEKAARIYVSRIAWVESFSALHRLRRDKALTGEEYATVTGEIAYDFNYFDIIEVGPSVVDHAVLSVERHGLKSLDSLQLGSALSKRHELTSFISFDERLAAAAGKEGLAVI